MSIVINTTQRSIIFLAAILFLSLGVIGADYLGLFTGMDTHIYDTCFRLRGTRAASDRIIIVAIDGKTLRYLGKWPLARRHYAEMLPKLEQAAAVGFDLLMTEPSGDDFLLKSAIQKHGRVVLPEYIDTDGHLTHPLYDLKPIRTGHVHIEPGIDNTAREIFHTIRYRNLTLPSLSSEIYETVAGHPFSRSLNRSPGTTSDQGTILQQDRRKINFYGPSGQFQRLSLADVLNGRFPAGFFHDKIALVGLTVPGIVDEVSTPLSQDRNRMPGVEVHAHILNNLLDSSGIRDVGDRLRLGAIVIMSIALAITFLRLNDRNAALLWLAGIAAMSVLSLALFCLANRWLPPTAFGISFSFAFLASYLYRLDTAARRLDREYEDMAALLGWDSGMAPKPSRGGGLFGLLSEGGINLKIQRQSRMTSKLINLHKQLEMALLTEREALDSQVRFIEMLSHEYRTPLAIIRANLDILEMKDGVSGGSHTTNFSKMKRAMSRLVEIMDNSLERRRLDDTRLEMVCGALDLVPFLERLVKESGELWAERRFELELAGVAACVIEGDGSLIKTATLNLIDNAVKYSPERETIRIQLHREEHEALIRVLNRGNTISDDDLGRVFEKYFRGAGSGNTRGAGLGLYLVRRIVEQHGGVVTLEKDTCGTTVAIIRLPVK